MNLSKQEFEYISSLTPIVNVDLLIYNEKKEILLSWRDDNFDFGWHFPGRCVRHKESLVEAVKNCSILEIGYGAYYTGPVEWNELFESSRNVKDHFISFLFECFLDSSIPLYINTGKKENDVGYLKWFEKCPDNLLKCHNIYKKYFKEC